MEKIVVTGGAGFIGSHVVDALINEGNEVHIVDNLSAGSRENVNPHATLHVEDIRDLGALRKIIAGAKYVFHLAAIPRVQYTIENPLESHDVNVNGTLNVLLAAKEGGVQRVVFAASSAAYGDQSIMPITENMSPLPKSPYGLQKLTGELYGELFSRIYDLPTVSLRYFNVYGPRMNPEGAYALVMTYFKKLRKEGKPLTITGDGTQTRDFVHVEDVVRATLLAAQSNTVGKGEVINIGAGKNNCLSVNKIAEIIGGPVEYIPARLEPHDTLADISKAKKLLGWEPVISIEEGLKKL